MTNSIGISKMPDFTAMDPMTSDVHKVFCLQMGCHVYVGTSHKIEMTLATQLGQPITLCLYFALTSK